MKAGEVFDINGIPIHPGDLLRSFHFTGPRRRKFYLYHFATIKSGSMFAVNVANFGPTNFILNGGGNVWIQPENDFEVIDGGPVGDTLLFTERKKKEQ